MNSKEREKILSIVQEGDEWVRGLGLVTDAHKNIIVHVMATLPRVEDYDVYIDPNEQRIEVVLYIKSSFLNLFFNREPKAIKEAYEFLTAYLPTYEVTVRAKRFRGDSNEDSNHDSNALEQSELSAEQET